MTVTAWMVNLRPERRGWRLGLGITLVALGVLALASLPLVGVVSTVLLSLALLTAGAVAVIGIFRCESAAEMVMMLILAAMLLITGGALLADPVRAQIALTTLLGTYLLLSGVARIVIALFNRRGGWAGAILHGVVSLFLGVLIFAQWPMSGVVALGLVVAIELIVVGTLWIVGARATQEQTTDRRPAHRSGKRRSAHASRRG